MTTPTLSAKLQAKMKRLEFTGRQLAELNGNSNLHHFAAVYSELIELWQQRVGPNVDILNHGIKFIGQTVTLQQVFALMPNQYQKFLPAPPSAGDAAWLDENVMNAIALLSRKDLNLPSHEVSGVWFAKDLASGLDYSFDAYYIESEERTFLEHQIWAMREKGPRRGEWNQTDVLYTIPPGVSKVAFFWNYTGHHWTLIVADLSEVNSRDGFSYTMYNSMEDLWDPFIQAKTQLPKLEILLRQESKLPALENEKEYKTARLRLGGSPQQENLWDCGIFALCNLFLVLQGLEPELEGEDCDDVRLWALELIREALKKLPSEEEEQVQVQVQEQERVQEQEKQEEEESWEYQPREQEEYIPGGIPYDELEMPDISAFSPPSPPAPALEREIPDNGEDEISSEDSNDEAAGRLVHSIADH